MKQHKAYFCLGQSEAAFHFRKKNPLGASACTGTGKKIVSIQDLKPSPAIRNAYKPVELDASVEQKERKPYNDQKPTLNLLKSLYIQTF